MMDASNYKIVFPFIADDGSLVFLTKEQREQVAVQLWLRQKRKESITIRKHNKLMRQTKRRMPFNPRLN